METVTDSVFAGSWVVSTMRISPLSWEPLGNILGSSRMGGVSEANPASPKSLSFAMISVLPPSGVIRPSILSCPKKSPLGLSVRTRAPRSSLRVLDATVMPAALSLATASASVLTPTAVSIGTPSMSKPPASA
ncbi:hypothetical protein YM3MPS_44860 [Mycobacterium pseudoshottsii]|nr:hypothetical protein DL240490_01449 [Mycobacterium marinum]BEH78683.1 hypothetical protein YM3MPS_44860 [Mycobacterium pseudoshottsii]